MRLRMEGSVKKCWPKRFFKVDDSPRRRALHKKSWAVIDRPYSLGCATVGALYGAVKKILRLDRKWTGDNGRSPCAVAQGDRPNGRSFGTVGRGPGGIGSGGVGVDTDQIGRRAEEAI